MYDKENYHTIEIYPFKITINLYRTTHFIGMSDYDVVQFETFRLDVVLYCEGEVIIDDYLRIVIEYVEGQAYWEIINYCDIEYDEDAITCFIDNILHEAIKTAYEFIRLHPTAYGANDRHTTLRICKNVMRVLGIA